MPYDNNEIMRNVPERLRSKVKGIGAPPTITDEPQETSNFDLPVFGPIAGNTITFNKAAELASNAIDTIKETNAYKKYFYNDAEKLAEAQKISGDLKIPVNAILANDTNLEKARDIYNYKQKQQQIMPDGEKSFDMKAVYAAYPELQKLANMDETQAAIALHNIENVKQTHGIIEAFKTGWHLDTLQLERSKLGQKGYYGELTEADRKRLTEIDEEIKNAKVLPDLLEAPVDSVIGNTAQQAPMMFRQFMNGQMFAIGSAVVGATVGAAGGLAGGGVTAVPGAAYGARIGYGIGSRIGFAKEMYNEILGNYYLDYIGYKDRQGRQLMSDTQARAWATLSTLAETGIEMANVESVIGILGSNPGTKEAANIVRDIVRRGADSASAKAQLKNWLVNNARNMGVVALSESAEEGVQNAVSMGVNTMAAKANPGGNIPSYSAIEMAQGAVEGAWQALPASIGFGAMAAAGSNLKYVRKVATAANEGREYIENARKNEAGIEMVANLLNNKAANKLAKEQPEVYKNVIKNTLEGSGAENVYVDTELLLQQEGGAQILNQLAAAAGIEGQALQDVIETKADIAVPVQDYVSMDGAQELHDKLRDLISFAVGADCFARNRKIAQQMKKAYDKMIAGDMERALQNIHNLAVANFEEGPQRDMAEFVLGQYEDPVEGIKEYRAERQRELDNMLDPVLATMREGMGQGVAILKDEDSGHYYRMSNNDPWYSKYYAENKKAPTQTEMKQIAEDILTGNNYYGVPGFDFRDAEAMEWAEANRAQIETIRQELETLDAIEEKIGNISKGELAAMEGLTPEGIRVYRRVAQELKNAPSKAVRQQAIMGALLTAHRAEIYAEAMRRAGNTDYTAEDYINRIRFEMGGNGGGGYNQAAGSRALTANFNSLDKAISMMFDEGATNEEILKETGWYKGADNRWRFEIPDNLDEIHLSRLLESADKRMELGNVYNNEKLYEAYPFLREVIVEVVNDKDGKYLGYADRSTERIVLNIKNETDLSSLEKDEIKSTLIHEIQHFIQSEEDFAVGGSPENVREKIEERIAKVKLEASAAAENVEAIKWFELDLQEDEILSDPESDWNVLDEIESEKENLEKHITTKALEDMRSYSVEITWLKSRLKRSDYLNYRDLAGEREARAAERKAYIYTTLSRLEGLEKKDALQNIENEEKTYINGLKEDEKSAAEAYAENPTGSKLLEIANKNKQTAYEMVRFKNLKEQIKQIDVEKEKQILQNYILEDSGDDNTAIVTFANDIYSWNGRSSQQMYNQTTAEASNKAKQLAIIEATNPMTDDYHTGIRTVDDILTAEEALGKNNFEGLYDDFTEEMAQKALETGKVTVYSSKPIETGGFVSTSKSNAQDYAGPHRKVYSKEISINDLAWIDESEGQYAPVERDYANLQSIDNALEKYPYVAVRGLNGINAKKKYRKGQKLAPSIDDPEGRGVEYNPRLPKLDGTSGIGVSELMSEGELLKMIEAARKYSETDNRIALIGGQSQEYGADLNEVVIENAVFLGYLDEGKVLEMPGERKRKNKSKEPEPLKFTNEDVEAYRNMIIDKAIEKYPHLNRISAISEAEFEERKNLTNLRNYVSQKEEKFLEGIDADKIKQEIENYKKGANFYNQSAYHGTPHSFDRFDLGAIGTGEGAQAHGWGLYFAADRKVAENYKENLRTDAEGRLLFDGQKYKRNLEGQWQKESADEVADSALSRALSIIDGGVDKDIAIKRLKGNIAYNERKTSENPAYGNETEELKKVLNYLENGEFERYNEGLGTLYEVDIPENNVLLDEQKPFKKQLKNVQKLIVNAIKALPEEQQNRFWQNMLGNRIGESRKTSDARQALKNKQGLIASLRNLNDPTRPAFKQRMTIGNIKSEGYTDEQIERMQNEPELVMQEIEKIYEQIPALENNLETSLAADAERNNEVIEAAQKKPEEAMQSSLHTGEKFYQSIAYAISGREYNYKAASRYLNEHGIKGITYEGGRDGRCFVVFDDKAISIINRYNQSAGIRARTANRELLNEAQRMAAEGKMQTEIYKKTGWRRGKDGRWRFEIPDNLDKIDLSKLPDNSTVTLGEIYDNEKLYAAYPQLRNVLVTKTELDDGVTGQSRRDEIYIRNGAKDARAKDTLIHEIQHVIQNIEGFASGGSPEMVKLYMGAAIREKFEEAEKISDKAESYYLIRNIYENAMLRGDAERMESVRPVLERYEAEIPDKAKRDKIYKLHTELRALEKKMRRYSSPEAYEKLYGEIEARNAVEKAEISTEMERTRNAGQPLDDILNEHLPKLPDEMKLLAEEYIELQKLPPGDEKFDREFEIENILITDENGEAFYDAVSASMWDSGTLEKQQQDFDEAVFDTERGDAIVLFNDNLVASYSMAEPEVQGQTAIMDNGQRVVYLFKNADQSTFMHEMAHIFFADMQELAEMENAPAQIKRDWETLKNWTAWNGSQIDEYIGTAVYNEFRQRDKEIRSALEEGYTFRNGERIELGVLLEEWRQERFARAFEEYLREGKAPKESLKSVFTRFKNWLLKIYKDIKTIGAEPSKEVKDVMDRMLATQEEIDAVMQKEDIDAFRKAGGFKYLSGTSAEMWEKIYADIHKDAYSKVIKIAMQDLTEQGQKEREQKIADERIAVRERISQEPVFIVWQYLQNNPQLDKEAAAQQIGGMTGEQYDFELNTRGGSLDAAAEREMRAIIAEIDAESPNKAELEQRAQEAVDTSYYKKLLTAYELEALNKSVKAEQKTSRKINDAADEGAARAISRLDRERARRENYEEEIKRLREQRGEERKQQRALRDVAAGNVETIREYAERKINELPIMQAANPVMWKKLSRQRARETEEAIAKNDWETARKAKKEQLVYDVMTDLATGNKKIVDKGVSTMKHRADIIRRSKNLGASDRYVYNHLLYVFGLAKRDAPMPPDYEGFVKTIVNYDQNLELTFIDTDGTVLLPDWLLNAGTATRPRDKGYIDLTVEDFKLLKDVMDNIYTAGREAKMAKAITDREGKKVDLDEAAAEIVKTITDTAFKKQTQDKKFGDESKMDMAARLAEEASMSLIKPETILRAMGDTAMRYIYDPLRAAANTEMKMNETLREQQAGILGAYRDGKVAKYLAQGLSQSEAEKRAESELNKMGSKKQYNIGNEQITKENLLAIALNWGTDINRKRVVDGYQVSYGFIEHALRQLDAADWQFVQNVWDLFETYWPDLQRVEANVTGVTLEKQPAMPFKIIGADGGVYNLSGGYYPLKYDAKKNIITSQREADEAARVNMQGASRLGMNLGNTKERVQGHVSLRIRTDLGVIDEALTDTVHNIAMRETVRDVIRLINNNEVRDAVDANWGAATWRTLNTWALDCWAVEPRSKSAYEKASQWLRTRQTQAVLGFRVSTALLNICNIGPMMEYIGAAEAVKAINDFYTNPQTQYNTIMAKSVFLRNRAETMDRDFGKLVKDNSNSAITKSAFWLITKTDLMLACPLWMHEYQKAYQKGIAKGSEPVSVEAAAIRAGDAAVRRVFGSGQTVDLAAVQRGGEFEKMFTMFYSYFSVVHNAIVLKVWEARRAKIDGKNLMQAMAPVAVGILFWMAIPAAIEAGIRAMIDDDDDDILDVAKGAGITFISTAVGGIPVLRDALPMALKAAAGEPVYNIRNNPLNETATQMLNVTRALSSDNKDALDVARAVLRMTDMITGLPQILTDGMIAAARWIDEGDLSEEDIQHYLWSILFGQNSKK